MILNLTFSLDSSEVTKRFWAYYFFTSNAIRGPEIPLINRYQGLYFGNNVSFSGASTNGLTIRFYAERPFSDVYWDFKNSINYLEQNGQVQSIQLTPVSQFELQPSTLLIGQYNPFQQYGNTGRYELTAYYVGNQVGFDHEVNQLADFTFELIPKLYMLMDLEQERKQIETNKVPFKGYLPIGKNG